MKGNVKRYYAADHARFTVAGMDLTAVPSAERSSDLDQLLDLLDEFHRHGTVPHCENSLRTWQYDFGTLEEFMYADAAQLKKWGIKNSMMERMSTSLIVSPGILRPISDKAWEEMTGFKNDCGFKSCGNGPHYSGDRETWHEHRLTHYAAHNDQIDWSDRTGSPTLEFIPNRIRTDELLRREIEHHAECVAHEETYVKGVGEAERRERTAKRKHELLKEWEGEKIEVVFHREVMTDRYGSLAGRAGEIGEKVCKANFYTFEPAISSKESKMVGGSMRKIYSLTGHGGRKQYISIDFKHGMLEFHDYRGTHLGEYRFNGEFNSEADPTHDLKSV